MLSGRLRPADRAALGVPKHPRGRRKPEGMAPTAETLKMVAAALGCPFTPGPSVAAGVATGQTQ
jgi:hypothetical protein